MQYPKLFSSTVLLIALAAIPIACSKKVDDDAIAKDIQTKVATDPDTKDADVTVASHDGKVTVSGKAPSPAVQQKIEQIAKAEPGVAAVDDQTAVIAADAGAAAGAAGAASAAAPAMAPAPPPKPEPKPEPVYQYSDGHYTAPEKDTPQRATRSWTTWLAMGLCMGLVKACLGSLGGPPTASPEQPGSC